MAITMDVLAGVLLTIVQCFCALILAVTFYAITRDQDRDVALLAMTFRVAEGVLGATGLSTRSTLNPMVGAMFFAAGSLLFCWLLLKGRLIPVPLAWIGVVASFVLVVFLPLELGNLFRGPLVNLMWIPMAAFEIPAGIWLLTKGVQAK